MGEGEYDYGGYFIVKGSEKFILQLKENVRISILF